MFHVLIVDDENLSVQTIRRTISWSELNVDEIYEASNGVEAQQILLEQTIHLVICDIEMPQMDGMTLIQWIREEKINVEIILLTCHASFDMAQKALRLGSAEYILKPVLPENLKQSCRRALSNWKEKEDYRSISRMWNTGVALRREQFFTDVICGKIPPTLRAMQNRAKSYGIALDEAEPVAMVMVCADQAGGPSQDARTARFGLRNVARELWQEVTSGWSCLVSCSEYVFLLLGDGIAELAVLQETLCLPLEQFARTYLDMDVRTYVAPSCDIQKICQQKELLQREYERERFYNLSAGNAAELDSQWIWRSTNSRWRGYVENHTPRLIQEEVVAALKNLSGSPKQRGHYLMELQEQILSAVRPGFTQEGLTELLPKLSEQEGAETTPLTDAQFLFWLEWLLQKLEQRQKGYTSDSTLVEKIQKYIVLNIHKDITREEIAAAVYMNPDYVARLFKQKTGLTLNAYIVQKRIGLAKQLLANTDISVGDISSDLGYSSFSHFTKLFKSSEGITPSEYRKLYRTGG